MPSVALLLFLIGVTIKCIQLLQKILFADGSYAIVATDAVQAKTAKAVLAADQIPCQIGAGLLSFMSVGVSGEVQMWRYE